MNCVAWNYHGLGNDLIIQALEILISLQVPQILSLLETKCDFKRIYYLKRHLRFSNCFSVPSKGRSGGLEFFFRLIMYRSVLLVCRRITLMQMLGLLVTSLPGESQVSMASLLPWNDIIPGNSFDSCIFPAFCRG